MKVILAGATGFIGGAVLERLVALPQISTIFALSRRELTINHPKLETVLIKDFSNYGDEVLSRLAGAEACIWCLGSPTDGQQIHLDYLMSAARAFSSSLLEYLPNDVQFRFVMTSGAGVEIDQEKKLWFMAEARKMRGQAEVQITTLEDQNPRQWASFIARPPFVASPTSFKPLCWIANSIGWYIPVEELAAAMVAVVVHGADTKRLETADMRRIGQRALASES